MEQKEKDGTKAGKSDEDMLKGLAASIQPVVSSSNGNAGAAPRVPGIPAVIPPMPAMPPIPSRVSDVQQYMQDLEKIRQGAEAAFYLREKKHTLDTLKTYGVVDIRESPIYRAFITDNKLDLEWKLETIIETIQIPSDYRGRTKIPFPPYDERLNPYLGGRYDAHGSKIRYHHHTEMFDRYEEQPFLNEAGRLERAENAKKKAEEEAKNAKSTPKTKVVTNATNVPAAQRPAAAQPKVKVVPVDPSERGNQFVYQPTAKTITILRKLKKLYENINQDEPPESCIPYKHVETTVTVEDLKGKKHTEQKPVDIYIKDEDLKIGTFLTLMGTLSIPGFSMETVQVGKKGSSSEKAGFTEAYLEVGKMIEILDHMLGETNWTIEISDSININNETQVVRGYYLDTLGNFAYGQIVSDSKIGTAINANSVTAVLAGRTDAVISNLVRTLIGDVFPALRGIGKEKISDVEKAQDQLTKAAKQAGTTAVRKYVQEQKENDRKERELDIKRQQLEYLQKCDLPKLLERVTDQPLKLLSDLASEPLQGVKRPPEEKEEIPEKRHITAEEADFKDITISKPKGTKEDEEKEV